MAVITPSTDLKLLKVPLEINDINQLTFADETAQFNYFNSLSKYDVDDDFTYQRYNGTIRFPAQYDEILTYNYVMYKNTAYSDKWFYAFITNIEYVNDGMTAITIKTDVWQTWQFDLTYKPVLIDREHANTDVPGDNLLPEQLELGELVVNGRTQNFGAGDGSIMLVAEVTQVQNAGTNQTLTYSWSDGSTSMPSPYVNGIPSGTYHIVIGRGSLMLHGLETFTTVYDNAGLSDSITNIYILPANIVNSSALKEGLTISTTGAAPQASASNLAVISSQVLGATNMDYAYYRRPETIDGYTPKNKKLLTYPFNYVNVSNNAGTTVPFHYEDFQSSQSYVDATFRVEGTCCPSGSIKAVPQNYKNLSYEASDNAYDYSISGAKFPICSWKSDAYTNWLTQNAVNMATEWQTALVATALGGLGGLGSGIIQGGGAIGATAGLGLGVIENGASLITLARDQMLAKTSANMVSDQSRGNANSGDVVFSKMKSEFTFIPMSIKAQYARCIDDYFSMFGYSTNRVKLPNITGRRNWNYVKTVGCYIEADIPQNDLAQIKAMFDNGVTFWHNPSTFADYSQNNDII